MRIKNGFISNSSSCSFIITLKAVTPDQIEQLVRYAIADPKIVADWKLSDFSDDLGGCGWFIDIYKDNIRGTTSMSDYDLHAWAVHLGIAESAMKFERTHPFGPDSWMKYQTDEIFSSKAHQHIGEWVAFNEQMDIIISAKTYTELLTKIQKEKKNEFDYITWIDPEYNSTESVFD